MTETRLDEPGPANPRGEALVRELQWVHGMIRRDLATVRQMADEVVSSGVQRVLEPMNAADR